MNAIAGGNTLGPLICGFIVSKLSWRWHKWIAVILTALNFIAVVLFVPETRYQRGETSSSSSPATSQEHVVDEKTTASSFHRPSSHSTRRLPTKSFLQNLSLWSGTPPTNLFKMFIRPFSLLLYPSVLLSFLTYSISLVLVVAINILNPFVLQAPPYAWSPALNGLINIPGILGNLIGAWAGGDLVDLWCKYRTSRNGGVYEPESRLYMLAVPFVITAAGCLLFGFGVQDALSWVSLFFWVWDDCCGIDSCKLAIV